MCHRERHRGSSALIKHRLRFRWRSGRRHGPRLPPDSKSNTRFSIPTSHPTAPSDLPALPPRTPRSRKDCAPVPLDIRISLFRKKLHGSDGSAFFFQMLSFYILETELAKRSMDASAKPPPHSLYLATSFSSRQRRETCSTTAAPTGGAEWGTPPPYS